MVRVTVPATSANMGSGYDSIGIALELYNVIDLAENDHIDISDKNGQYVPQDESNLIYQCAKRVYDECGKPLSAAPERKCPACGEKLEDSDAFCPACGAVPN